MHVILPKWATKPRHKNEVVASDRGWIVKDTGELLVSSKNLETKLIELHKTLLSTLEQVESYLGKPAVNTNTWLAPSESNENMDALFTGDVLSSLRADIEEMRKQEDTSADESALAALDQAIEEAQKKPRRGRPPKPKPEGVDNKPKRRGRPPKVKPEEAEQQNNDTVEE